MTRVAATFESARAAGHGVLVAYLTAFDPDEATSEVLLVEAARAGAGILEVGVPFSDPTADGPVIVRASGRALRAGASVAKVIRLVARVRRAVDVPLVLFSYYNPLLQYGADRLAADLAAAGGDAILVVDLPPEEAADLASACRRTGLDLVALLAPTSTPERVAAAASVGSGFVYYVSVTGVTGGRIADPSEVGRQVAEMRSKVALPIVVGFGVRTPEDARALSRAADGVVVGSALVERVEKATTSDEARSAVAAAVSALRAAM
jgi:tryptophan synthase alpha chain